ncbi:beta-mannosidase [Deinococcus metalli]|uniref:beta-mannosidase n=1 Tax=Deinococcus metalli TaxID=1141878 RepID=A0A7W8KHN7_9DEIO|nr:glycoside hydrolase family 2 protein [Deinococcus metalli]MBB5377983.1 beta-mannosidase [Deinococcus metalli]GHF53537.1 hypothetical protein GCM10017781_32190 [Deinococcus metalli]
MSRPPASSTPPSLQTLNGAWELAPSLDEQWRFRGLHTGAPQAVGAFARTAWMPARVPGSVHADLLRAGVIPDVRVGLHSVEAEWVAARQWVYRRTFRVDLPAGGRLWLRFGGVDWAATVFLDGEELGRLEGAQATSRLRLPDLERHTKHSLVVVLDAPPAGQGQLGRTSQTRTLRPRYGYWWDFCTRLIQVGLVGDVTLERDGGAALLDVAALVSLSADGRRGQVRVDVAHDGAEDLPVTATLTHPDGRQETRTGRADDLCFDLAEPQLWWPRGLGEQPRYHLSAQLDGSAPVSCRFGVRDVQLVHNAASAARGAMPYTLQVNGVPVYARGFNVLPVDMTAGMDGAPERERAVIEYAAAAHATLLRFNGVAPFASQTMLEACDDLGVLVWQELPLTSSGTDNVPPALETFGSVLDAGLPPLLRRLHGHPSVALLGAGNELTGADRRPVHSEHPTIAHMLTHVRRAGLTQPFMPTSPSGPTYDLDETVARTRPEDLHDVHGPWHYRGVRDSYRPHAISRALMHSEFGCQAPARERSLRRFVRPDPWPMDDRVPEVVHHGEWWLMRHRVEEVFGPVADLRRYVLLGQAAQGDVLRHALTWNRSRVGECSAALVWQLNEPWPNAHNTAVLEYDLSPKLAYYRCREANAPYALHWGLDAPVAAATLTLRPAVLADTPGRGRVELRQLTPGGTCVWERHLDVTWPGEATSLSLPIIGEPTLLRGRVLDDAGALLAESEQWVAPDRPTPFAALADLPDTRIHVDTDGSQLTVTNAGRVAAPWLSLEALEDGLEVFSDSGFTLLPGESRSVTATLRGLDGAARPFTLSVQAVNVAPVHVEVTP